MASATKAQGTQIQMDIGGTFTTIATVSSFQGPGGTASVIDVTNLQSTAKEKIVGLKDEGQFSFDLFFVNDSTFAALQTARNGQTAQSFKVIIPAGENGTSAATLTFTGYVLELSVSGAVDGAISAKCTIEIDGSVTWA